MIEKSRQEAGEGGGELYGANALRRTQTQAAAGRSSAFRPWGACSAKSVTGVALCIKTIFTSTKKSDCN